MLPALVVLAPWCLESSVPFAGVYVSLCNMSFRLCINVTCYQSYHFSVANLRRHHLEGVKFLLLMHWICNTTAPSSVLLHEGDWALVNIYPGHPAFFPLCPLVPSIPTSTLSLGVSLSDQSLFTPFHSSVLKDWEPTCNKSVELLGMHFWIGFILGSVYVPTFIFLLLLLACLFPPHTFSCICYLPPAEPSSSSLSFLALSSFFRVQATTHMIASLEPSTLCY